ncbi:MAG: hypothetical protein RXO24_11470, partial [Acidilobus sp.]
GLGRIVLGIIVGGVVFGMLCAIAGFLSGVSDHILQTLNETGFTIPASANYVAPIESLASSACSILRTLSGLPSIIQIILIVLIIVGSIVGVREIIKALLKLYDSLIA